VHVTAKWCAVTPILWLQWNLRITILQNEDIRVCEIRTSHLVRNGCSQCKLPCEMGTPLNKGHIWLNPKGVISSQVSL
jgi:hypothetical protein